MITKFILLESRDFDEPQWRYKITKYYTDKELEFIKSKGQLYLAYNTGSNDPDISFIMYSDIIEICNALDKRYPLLLKDEQVLNIDINQKLNPINYLGSWLEIILCRIYQLDNTFSKWKSEKKEEFDDELKPNVKFFREVFDYILDSKTLGEAYRKYKETEEPCAEITKAILKKMKSKEVGKKFGL